MTRPERSHPAPGDISITAGRPLSEGHHLGVPSTPKISLAAIHQHGPPSIRKSQLKKHRRAGILPRLSKNADAGSKTPSDGTYPCMSMPRTNNTFLSRLEIAESGLCDLQPLSNDRSQLRKHFSELYPQVIQVLQCCLLGVLGSVRWTYTGRLRRSSSQHVYRFHWLSPDMTNGCPLKVRMWHVWDPRHCGNGGQSGSREAGDRGYQHLKRLSRANLREVVLLAGYCWTCKASSVGPLLLVRGTPTQESHCFPSSRREVRTRRSQDCRTLLRRLRCPVMFLRS